MTRIRTRIYVALAIAFGRLDDALTRFTRTR